MTSVTPNTAREDEIQPEKNTYPVITQIKQMQTQEEDGRSDWKERSMGCIELRYFTVKDEVKEGRQE